MKNLVISVLVCFSICACQSTKPPEDVSDAFIKKFAAAEKVSWDQEEENEWEAEFMMGGKKMSACFDNSGNWFETETEVSLDELPASTIDSINFRFEGFEIEETASIEKIDFAGFEIIIVKGKEELEILINTDGEISGIKHLENNDNEEDEEEDN